MMVFVSIFSFAIALYFYLYLFENKFYDKIAPLPPIRFFGIRGSNISLYYFNIFTVNMNESICFVTKNLYHLLS